MQYATICSQLSISLNPPCVDVQPSSMPAAEWAADAKERELEKIALQHIKAEAKAAERAQRVEVCSSTPSYL